MEKEYFKNIDFLRFIFTITIVIYHVIGIAAAPLKFEEFYSLYRNNTVMMKYCVEFFFIISGFFLVLTFKPKQSVAEFIKSKFIRLMPPLAFTLGIFLVASFFKLVKFWPMDNIFSLLFLNGIQIVKHSSPYLGTGNVHSSWFVSVLFWVSLLYFYIMKYFDRKIFHLLCAIIVYLGLYWKSYNLAIIIPSCCIRGLSSIALGCIIGQIYLSYREHIKNLYLNILSRILITCAELGIFGYLMFGLYFATKDRLVRTDLIFLFVVLFILFIFKKGYFSRLLENNFSVLIGSVSYSIFITHCFWLDIFKKYYFIPNIVTFSQPKSILSAIAICTFVCTVFGIFTYYLIEKPAVKYLSKKFKKEKVND